MELTPEQQALIVKILLLLDNGAVKGNWPGEVCSFCTGISSGYYDSQDFTHRWNCVVLLIRELRETI
jgi:hypothetical protein